jgi:large subunit ribosomal protein L21
MYAVVKVGGKQERVEPGDVIEVELMKADPGDVVELPPIVVFDDDGKAHVGKDLSKATVRAKLLGDKKGDKLRVFKYRPKSGYRRSQGHRQLLTLLEIQEVALRPQKKATAAAEKEPAPAKKPATTKPAARKSTAASTTGRKKAAAKKATAKKASTKATGKKATGKKATGKRTSRKTST